MEPQLAGKFVESKVEKQLPLLGQIKYDGIRIFFRDGIAWTRSLKPARSETLQSMASWNKQILEGLDGEVICGDPTAKDCFRRSSQFVSAFNQPDQFTFYAFDKWNEPTKTTEQRLEIVEEVTACWRLHVDVSRLELAETVILHTMEDVWEYYSLKADEGHEGIILRSPNSLYKFGRGTPVQCQAIKMKERGWIDTECRILEFHEQKENTNEATVNALGRTERSGHQDNLIGKGTLGAIEVSGTFENGREFTCRVGTGLDDETRQAVWNSPEEYRGKLVKMKYFSVGIKDKPRFPTFLGFRETWDLNPVQGSLFDN